ncbi:MAG: serine hydroxymethyltransferase, partial [Leptospirales bacterium]|nr:serine hydroxymethyltransferase [Leptospirales bacterium]
EAGITANKNGIPFDPNPPAVTSGVRFGSPALTTRGFGKDEFVRVGNLICDLLSDAQNPANIQKVNGGVLELARKFPMAGFRLG